RLELLHELGVRLLAARKAKTPSLAFARDLLAEFYDICMRCGLDGVLVELEQRFPPLDPADRSTLYEHPTLRPALAAQLDAIDLDGGGPRNAKPVQLASSLVAALGLTVADEPDRSITL